MMLFPPMCPGIIKNGISGIGEQDHRWVEVQTYTAPNTEDGQPARWTDVACEKCGAISMAWERIAAPADPEDGR